MLKYYSKKNILKVTFFIKFLLILKFQLVNLRIR